VRERRERERERERERGCCKVDIDSSFMIRAASKRRSPYNEVLQYNSANNPTNWAPLSN